MTVPPSQGAEPLQSRCCAGLWLCWRLDWWHRWSMRNCKHLGFAYNYRTMSRLTDHHFPLNYLLSPLMQAAVSSAVADYLMAIKAHLTTRPNHVPENLIAAVRWQAIGELYHVSWSPLGL